MNMAKNEKTQTQEDDESKLYETGIGSSNAKSIIVSAVLETTGHVRFGDGTEVNLTITEKDLLPFSKETNDGYKTDLVEKVVLAGSKRRGIDRRTIHALRNALVLKRYNLVPHNLDAFLEIQTKLTKLNKKKNKNASDNEQIKGLEDKKKEILKTINLEETLLTEISQTTLSCYIPNLCLKCPSCWFYGATAMGEADYNIKSRVLYATAYSIEPSMIAVVTHARNMVNEKTHTTAGEAGIHEEEFIRGGVHFPTITVMDRIVDWEAGMFAHALIENVNQNKYTAASGRQGGIMFSEDDGNKLIVIDISPISVFPLETIKIPADITEYDKVVQSYKDAVNLEKIKEILRSQGFEVNVSNNILEVKKDKLITILIDKDGVKKYDGDRGLILEIESKLKEVKTLEQLENELTKMSFSVEKINIGELQVRKGIIFWKIKKEKNEISVVTVTNSDEKEIMKRIYGNEAYGYLKEKEEEFKRFLETFDEQKWNATHTSILKSFGIGSKGKMAKEEAEEEIEESEEVESP